MDVSTLRDYCLSKPGATEDLPFDENTLVFKVMNKMFALTTLDEFPGSMNLKCDPEYAFELRERYAAVKPGYHQNKKHWNTVEFDGSIRDAELRAMIDHSYDLVVKGLKKSDREKLEG